MSLRQAGGGLHRQPAPPRGDLMGAWVLPIVFFAVLLYLAHTVLTPFVVAGVLAYIFSPVVDQIRDRARIPRIMVVALLYVVLLGGLGLGIWLIEGRLVREFRT